MAKGKKFTGESARRIARTVRRVEGMPLDLSEPSSGPRSVVPVMTRLVGITSTAHHRPGASATDAVLAAWSSSSAAYVGDASKRVAFADEFRVGLGRDSALAMVAKRPGDSRWNVIAGQFYRWCYAEVYAEVSAADGATPGSGEATIKWLDGDGEAIEDGPVVDVKNYLFAAAIPVGTTIEIAWQPFEGAWWIRRAPDLAHFAVVQTGWTNTKAGVGVGSRVSETVSVKTCDYDDATATSGEAFDVETMPHPHKDTALFEDTSIIEWALAPGGDRVIVSDIWDDPIGIVKWESVDTANVRDGWRLCNGVDGALDLSRMFIMSLDAADGAGDGSENEIGDSGGFSEHGGATNDHDDHTEAEVCDCIEDHTKAQVAQTLDDHTIADHDAISAHATAVGGDFDGYIFNLGMQNHDAISAHNITKQHEPGAGNDLDHVPTEGNDLEHSTTDNRPRFYVLAAIERFE